MKKWLLASAPLIVSGVIVTLVAYLPTRAQNVSPGGFPDGQKSSAIVVTKETGSYREIVKKILPAVVSLEGKVKSRKQVGRKGGDAVPDESRRFFEVPDEGDGPQFGSGFLIHPHGVVVTNFHVVEGLEEVEVQLHDGRKFTSKDIKTDPKTDLAIVRIDAKGELPFLEFDNSDEMQIGDRVLAAGAPFRLTGSVTSGIISGKSRSLKMNLYEDFLQTDAAINPGNSGGPLVNLEGKVIGINAAIKTRSGGSQGVGLAIPSNMAKTVVDQLLKDGIVRRGYLGVQMKDLIDADLAEQLGVGKRGGILVTMVFSNTPAARAGIQDGDVIVSIAGKPVKEGREFQTIVGGLPLGKPVEIQVVRDGKTRELMVPIEEQPKEFGSSRVTPQRSPKALPPAVSLDKIGIDIVELSQELAEQLGYRDSVKGVLITRVVRDSIAADAGLVTGMVINKIDRQPLRSTAECKELLGKVNLNAGVLLQVQTPQGGASFLTLKSR